MYDGVYKGPKHSRVSLRMELQKMFAWCRRHLLPLFPLPNVIISQRLRNQTAKMYENSLIYAEGQAIVWVKVILGSGPRALMITTDLIF